VISFLTRSPVPTSRTWAVRVADSRSSKICMHFNLSQQAPPCTYLPINTIGITDCVGEWSLLAGDQVAAHQSLHSLDTSMFLMAVASTWKCTVGCCRALRKRPAITHSVSDRPFHHWLGSYSQKARIVFRASRWTFSAML
jgi:hypothetical protein